MLLKTWSVPIVLYWDDEMISSSKGMLFECLNGPKVVSNNEDTSLDALRKTIMDAIKCSKILLSFFYSQPIY